MPSDASVTSKTMGYQEFVSVSVMWITPWPTAVGVMEIMPLTEPPFSELCLKFRMPMLMPS